MPEVSTVINMMSKKKYIWVFVVLALISAVSYGIKEYNRKPADLSKVNPEETISAVALITSFKNNEVIANKTFLGKTVLVNGIISEIDNENDTLLNIYLGDSTLFEKVSCSMDMSKREEYKKLKQGQQISIKGFCTGYLQDVELNRCVIFSTKK